MHSCIFFLKKNLPAIKINFAHLIRPCIAAFINGVMPKLFLTSTFMLRLRDKRRFTTSCTPVNKEKK